MGIDLSKLSEPFLPEDVEWRVNRVPAKGLASKGVWVLPYVKARALHARLDQVCGVDGWRTERPECTEVGGRGNIAVGLSIWVEERNEWISRWDVSQPLGNDNIDPMKAGYTYAFKRAAAQFGLGRHLKYVNEQWADIREDKPDRQERGWNFATLPKNKGGDIYYWKTPSLPGAVMPKEPFERVSREEVMGLFEKIRNKKCPDCQDSSERQEAITRFIWSIAGEFHVSDPTCWTRDALKKCTTAIEATTDANGISGDVPFGK